MEIIPATAERHTTPKGTLLRVLGVSFGAEHPGSVGVVIGSVVVIVALYLLVNLALLHVLPLSRLAASRLPGADAAQIMFGARGGAIITALSVLSLLSVMTHDLWAGRRHSIRCRTPVNTSVVHPVERRAAGATAPGPFLIKSVRRSD
jgi:amino acid transporter